MHRQSEISNRKSQGAFTLVELLVVVTIIIVLLALLLPAMGRAIYQANLATCGAKLRAVAGTMTIYAMDNKRFYPDRGIRNRSAENEQSFISAMALSHPTFGYDQRPQLKKVLDINKYLQCPLSDTGIDMVNTDMDVNTEASYVMFWGWQYRGAKVRGIHSDPSELTEMLKYGDKWGYLGNSYGILAADIDLVYHGIDPQGSHPDRNPVIMFQIQATDEPIFGFRSRVSRWLSRSQNRGVVDLNYAYDDGSTRRHNEVIAFDQWSRVDPRMNRVPLQYDDHRPNGQDLLQVPKEDAG